MSESRPEPIEGKPQDGWSGPTYEPQTSWTPPDYGTPPTYQQPSYEQPAYQPGDPTAQQFPAPMPGQMPYQSQPLQQDSGATPALVVGIVALGLGFIGVGIGFLISPIALVLGVRSKRRIDASHGQLGGRSNAQAGFILGLIGTIFLVLFALLFIGLIAIFAVGSSGGTF